MPQVIQVIVAARQPLVRNGLRAVLSDGEDFQVVGQAATASELGVLVARQHPRVALVAGDLGAEDSATLWGLAGDPLSPAVVVLVSDATGDTVASALRAGARGVLHLESADEEIQVAVRAAAAGLTVLHPAALPPLLLPAGDRRAVSTAEGEELMTPRELEVLQLLAQGLANKMIAQRLKISDHTVKFHVGAIMAKLNAASRTEAVTAAARRGILML